MVILYRNLFVPISTKRFRFSGFSPNFFVISALDTSIYGCPGQARK